MAHQRLTASSPPSSTSVAIIGAGSVGSTIAYALILGKVSSEIILVDVDEARCQGQVDDLSDAQFVSNTRIKTGTV